MFILKSKFYTWLLLSIIVAILFSCTGLKLAFESIYTIQDDTRQHIFWMQQFNNSDLFQEDLIGDYFKSVSPWGFTTLYKLVSNLGIDIFWFNKISPLLIGVVTTIYCFLVCLEFIPIPLAGFFSCLLLNQNLWMVDDLSSGTPRAYIYPLLLAFLYYLLRRNIFLCVITILLQGLLYPPAVLISATILLINCLRKKQIKNIHFWGLLTATIVLIFYALKTSDFGNIITLSQAKLLPEFTAEGRSAFFSNSWSQFWLTSRRSGLFPIEWQYSLMCSYGIFILWLPSFPKTFPLGQKISNKTIILADVLLASVVMFVLAHLLLFKLHLPGRYTHHTLRIIIALLDGIVLTVVFDFITRKINHYLKYNFNLIKIILLIVLTCLLLYPTYAVQTYPQRLGYITGNSPQLYQFLQQYSLGSTVATLSKEADFIPSFTGQSVLVAAEYAIPYHQGYYQQFRQRVKDLITAQYSPNLITVRNFIQKYNIDLWLIDQNVFTIEYLQDNQWLRQFQPETKEAINTLQNNYQPSLLKKVNNCTIFKQQNLNLLSAQCILQSK